MSTEATHDIHPDRPRWTHIALRVDDLERSIAWYEKHTPLALLDRSTDDLGEGAWLADPKDAAAPFVLVLSHFNPETDPFGFAPPTVLGPFAHLGFELLSRDAVDAGARPSYRVIIACAASSGSAILQLWATAKISSSACCAIWRVWGKLTHTPAGERVTAPNPLQTVMNKNFIHMATWMSAGTSALTPARTKASLSCSTRRLDWLSISPSIKKGSVPP